MTFAASPFSDLDLICTQEEDGIHNANHDKLILKHINQRITKTEWYVKIDSYLYMVANTFTDDYRFLGAYFLRYDCLDGQTMRLSSLIRWNDRNELGFLTFDPDSYNMKITFVGFTKTNTIGIYDFSEQKLKKINYKFLSRLKNKNVSVHADLSSYTGNSINIEFLYYTKVYTWNGYSYKYENYGNPDIIHYNF